jgi:hypothetical protein
VTIRCALSPSTSSGRRLPKRACMPFDKLRHISQLAVWWPYTSEDRIRHRIRLGLGKPVARL